MYICCQTFFCPALVSQLHVLFSNTIITITAIMIITTHLTCLSLFLVPIIKHHYHHRNHQDCFSPKVTVKPPHLFTSYPLVNTTGVTTSWSHWSEGSFVAIAGQLVFGHIQLCVLSPSDDYFFVGYLEGAVTLSMSDVERPRLGRRTVQRDPFCTC